MKIAVFGTGGVGGYFGGKLAQAGEDVTFIARGAHLEAIRRQGLIVISPMGGFEISPAKAESDPAAVGPVDVVLMGVKAWQVPEAAEFIRPLVGRETVVIPLQNGVEAPVQLAAVLGQEHVTGGLCRISAFISAPGVITHAGLEPSVDFNWTDGRRDERLERLQEAFTRVGVTANIPADILAAMWVKFVFIASISGVGAAARVPVGGFRSIPETRRLLERAIAEAAAVGRAEGVDLPAELEANTLRFIDNLPPNTIPSMQRDIMDGKPSELEFQNGTVVRLGSRCGVETPVHSFLYACLLPQERGRSLD